VSALRAAALALLVCEAALAEETPAPLLPAEHVHPSGAFTFRTPADWPVAGSSDDPLAVETGADGLLARFLVKEGGHGFDALHVECMLVRLAPDMAQHPQVKYEHDFLSGSEGDLRFLDSAFVVTYDEPVLGHTRWRQRNVTVVGPDISLCAITYAPAEVWKKSKEVRALLDAVLGSVRFREPDP
jgi:hypothetical protein